MNLKQISYGAIFLGLADIIYGFCILLLGAMIQVMIVSYALVALHFLTIGILLLVLISHSKARFFSLVKKILVYGMIPMLIAVFLNTLIFDKSGPFIQAVLMMTAIVAVPYSVNYFYFRLATKSFKNNPSPE